MRRCNAPVSLAEALKASIQRLGISRRIKEGLVIHKWESMVGPEIARIAIPSLIRNGVLWIRVENNIWANELSLLVPKLLKKIARQIGRDVVKDIRFKVDYGALEGSYGEFQAGQTEGVKNGLESQDLLYLRAAQPEDLRFVDSVCKVIPDDRLRQSFSNFVLTARAMQRYKATNDK